MFFAKWSRRAVISCMPTGPEPGSEMGFGPEPVARVALGAGYQSVGAMHRSTEIIAAVKGGLPALINNGFNMPKADPISAT